MCWSNGDPLLMYTQIITGLRNDIQELKDIVSNLSDGGGGVHAAGTSTSSTSIDNQLQEMVSVRWNKACID